MFLARIAHVPTFCNREATYLILIFHSKYVIAQAEYADQEDFVPQVTAAISFSANLFSGIGLVYVQFPSQLLTSNVF